MDMQVPSLDVIYIINDLNYNYADAINFANSKRYVELRRIEYNKRGVTDIALIVATAEAVLGNDEKLIALQNIRLSVKEDIPKVYK